MTDAEGGAESYSFTAARPGSPAAVDNPLVATGQRRRVVDFDLGASTVTTALGAGPATTGPTANAADATVAAPGPVTSAIPGRRPAGCSRTWTKVKSYPRRPETFMNLWTVGTATVDEEVGSSHSLGVGVAVTGGGWSASGTETVETHTSAGHENSYARNYSLRNYVNYAHYTKRCFKTVSGRKVSYYKHRLSATGMHSLQVGQTAIKDHVWGDTRAAWGRSCTRANGGTFHKTQGSNLTFEAGVTTPFINLSAQASYSEDTTVYWPLPKSGRTWMCGSSASGPATAAYAGEDKNPGPSVGGCGARCWVAAGGAKR